MEPTTHIAEQDALTENKKRIRDLTRDLEWDRKFVQICKDQNRGPEAVARAQSELDNKLAKLAKAEQIVKELEAKRLPESELPYNKLLQFFNGANREAARNGLELLKVAIEEGCYLPGFSRRITSCLNPAKISKKANKVAFESEFAPVKAQMDHLARIIRQEPNAKFRTGTCQCCFNRQKVSQKDGKHVSLHGYERPGIGYILGRCRGEDEVPYEVSCEKTKVFRAELVQYRARQKGILAAVVAGEVPSFKTTIHTGKEVPCSKSWRGKKAEEVEVTVLKGEPEKQNPYMPEKTWEKIPSYETLQEKAQRALEREISHLTRDIDFLTEKIDTWVQLWKE